MDRFIKTDTECVGAEALAAYGAKPAEAVQDAPDRGGRRCRTTARPSRRTAREVGVVTSPASSPRLGTIGARDPDADVATDGGKVEVAVEGGTAPATVDVLSPLDPEKEKPRA